MAPQYSLPTRLSDYIAFLLPWAHGHQLKAIGAFVAAWVGALSLIGLQEAGASPFVAAWIAMAIVLGLRLAAIRFHITLPALGQTGPR